MREREEKKKKQQSIETKLATLLSIWFRGKEQKTHIQHFCYSTTATTTTTTISVAAVCFSFFSPQKTESINFQFSHLEMIYGVSFTRVSFCLFSFLPSPFFYGSCRTPVPFLSVVRKNILNHFLNIVFRVRCFCVLIVNILFNFWWQSHTSW